MTKKTPLIRRGLQLFSYFVGLLFSLGHPLILTAHAATLVNSTTVEYQYSGSDGSLVFQWVAPDYNSGNTIGTILIKPSLNGSSSQEIDLHPSAMSALGTMVCQSATWSQVSGNYRLNLRLTAGGSSTHVYITPILTGKVLSVHVTADSAIVSQLNIGKWPSSLSSQSITVPYYSQQLLYFQSLNLYANSDFDWTISQASALTTNMAVYSPLTNGSLNLVNETFRLSISENIAETFPSIPNSPSPYIAQQSGRMIVDITQDLFTTMAHGFYSLGQIGINNCLGIIHSWQFGGYDNQLPAVMPANSVLGGDTALKAASSEASNAGCLFSLHENYADYYPNYPSFNQASISLLSNGQLKYGWLNTKTGIQSYATKPTWLLKNAVTQSPNIHASYSTTAAYIDVNPATNIGARNDMDASQSGAGSIGGWMTANRTLFQYERQTHNGPLMGEGGFHWFYSGLLDGVEAQTGVGAAGNIGETLPLFVDFDLLRIHPLQVNHGMGRYTRWLRTGESINSIKLTDAYRMQEIAFGHAPYLGYELWKNTPFGIQEQALVSPVATRYGTATASSIQYQVGGLWTDTQAAIKANDFSRVQVTYSNGDKVVANSQASNLIWRGLTIPQYGWAASGNNMLAYTAIQGGMYVDYAQTPTSFFANARNQGDYQLSGMAQPVVTKIQQSAQYQFTLQLSWNVLQDFPSDGSKVFVHFINVAGGSSIAFQADYYPTISTDQWKTGNVINDRSITVPLTSSTPDGQYSVRLGLETLDDSTRLVLSGLDDGSYRYIVGTLTISNSGKTITFRPQAAPASDPRLNTNPPTVNFGSIQTDGMVRLKQVASDSAPTVWELRVFPPTRNVTVRFNSSTISIPSSITCDQGKVVVPYLVQNGAYWQVATKGTKKCIWPVN